MGEEYLLLVSGTFNPPHKGHVELGFHAARQLIQAGKRVSRIIYSPIHDNYLTNKLMASGDQPNAMFTPMSDRLSLFRRMLPTIHRDTDLKEIEVLVLDYEHQKSNLLAKSSYWEKKLPTGYLKTLPTASLVKTFSQEFARTGVRVAVVFGCDNVAYMPSWTSVGTLFNKADLILVGRDMSKIEFSSDPSEFLANFSEISVHYILPHCYNGEVLFGERKGVLRKRWKEGMKGSSRLYIMPPLKNDEGKSSTKLRNLVGKFCGAVESYGYREDDMARLLKFRFQKDKLIETVMNSQDRNWVGDKKGVLSLINRRETGKPMKGRDPANFISFHNFMAALCGATVAGVVLGLRLSKL